MFRHIFIEENLQIQSFINFCKKNSFNDIHYFYASKESRYFWIILKASENLQKGCFTNIDFSHGSKNILNFLEQLYNLSKIFHRFLHLH